MKLHALLCFYDEPIPALVTCIRTLAEAGVDHIVAVDGAYEIFPDAAAASHPNQQAAIAMACRELGVACTLHVPSEPWHGNEVEKRSFLFALGWASAEPGDWFWVQDADMFVTAAPDDLKARLAATEHATAEVMVVDVVAQQAKQLDWPETFAMRSLFRAQPIVVGPAHCVYRDADGRSLWNGSGVEADAGTLDLTGMVTVDHRPDARPPERQVAKLRYYAERDARGIERGACSECGERAARLVAVNWRMSEIGAVADWTEACEAHAPRFEADGRAALVGLGLDPDSVRVENRNGRAPVGCEVEGVMRHG